MTPKVSLVAWEDRLSDLVFVAIPDQRGRYLRTDRSVALVSCPVCKSLVGEPCKSNQTAIDEYASTTHYRRRVSAKPLLKLLGKRVNDVLEKPHTVPDEYMESNS